MEVTIYDDPDGVPRVQIKGTPDTQTESMKIAQVYKAIQKELKDGG